MTCEPSTKIQVGHSRDKTTGRRTALKLNPQAPLHPPQHRKDAVQQSSYAGYTRIRSPSDCRPNSVFNPHIRNTSSRRLEATDCSLRTRWNLRQRIGKTSTTAVKLSGRGILTLVVIVHSSSEELDSRLRVQGHWRPQRCLQQRC